MAADFHLRPRGPFDLAASKGFLEGFTPADQPSTDDDELTMALLTDDWNAAVVRLWQTSDGVLGEVVAGSADRDVLRGQVERMLSLDIDGTGFAALGQDDEVLAGMQARYPGLRPVQFATPYEAACWSVLSQRTRMTHAATVRRRLAELHGAAFEHDGVVLRAFPPPQVLTDVDQVDGASAQKVERLHAVAAAALDGALDPEALRALPTADALAELRGIHGVGPFGADLILARGAGAPDLFPAHEGRLHQAMAELYELDAPDVDELAGIAERWRPYRTWAALLFRTWFERER